MSGVQVVTATAVVSVIVYLALVTELFSYLRDHRNRARRELGEPALLSTTWTSTWRCVKFLFFGGYGELWHDKNVRERLIVVWVWLAVTAVTS